MNFTVWNCYPEDVRCMTQTPSYDERPVYSIPKNVRLRLLQAVNNKWSDGFDLDHEKWEYNWDDIEDVRFYYVFMFKAGDEDDVKRFAMHNTEYKRLIIAMDDIELHSSDDETDMSEEDSNKERLMLLYKD